ncbi:unnamed protein product [Bursaphelenchus xylophilus]|uniref:(pine wood nematode) hypothetical protein n=1 Tax=Bursaphelenchus xylophilus TaxID=6326 RepID=A0A1I7RZL1_BURXY|nr:unnamed protein product [Bursaphelenchus xylophilus]CAG9111360.1 unnamed protein product [Bursaphelenchus xylophilus]
MREPASRKKLEDPEAARLGRDEMAEKVKKYSLTDVTTADPVLASHLLPWTGIGEKKRGRYFHKAEDKGSVLRRDGCTDAGGHKEAGRPSGDIMDAHPDLVSLHKSL